MAKRNDDCNFARPRMLYGEDSHTLDTTGRESFHKQQATQGSGDDGPAQGTARLVRSYSRKFQRSSQTKPFAGTHRSHDSVLDDVISSCVQTSGSNDGSVRGSHLTGSVADIKFNESAAHRVLGDIDVHRQINESVNIKVDESDIDKQCNESFADRKFDESTHDGKYDEDAVKRTFDEGVVGRQAYHSIIGRDAFSSAMGRKLSGSVIDSHLDSNLAKIKPYESDIGRKSAASVWGRKLLESAVDRKLAASILGRNSKYSIKLTPVDHSRTSRRIKAGSRNQSNKSRRSRMDNPSRRASYYHRDIVDEDLLISAAKLDSTLIRLFSHARENNRENLDEQDPQAALMPFLKYSQSDLISMDAVMWRVFPMDATQKETLDQELPFIEANLTPNDITRHLYDKSILTLMDYNQLARTEGQGEKAVTRLMVKTLQRRGDKAYPAFLEALQAHSYEDICARLAETERCLRDAMATESSDSGNRSKMDHACMHQYQSGTTSKPRTLRTVEANENSSPPMLISSPNQVSTFDNDTGLTNHTHSHEHTPLGGIHHVEEKAALEDNPAGSDLHILSSNQLEKQLLELVAEFQSLQKEVIAMKSAPSPQGSVEETCSNSDEESEQPESHSATHEVPSVNMESITTNHSACLKDLTPESSPRKGAQKSIHCIIL